MEDITLRECLKKFSDEKGLTPKEQEIVSLLAGGVISLKELCQCLSVTPNTINTHLHAIYAKAGVGSRSQLLADFLKYCVTKCKGCRVFRRTPHILVVDDEP